LPPTRDERRAAASGIAVALLNIQTRFAAANAGAAGNAFSVRLFDRRKALDKQLLAVWNESQAGARQSASATPLVYAEEFALASHLWSVQIEAAPAWLDENGPSGQRPILQLGVLATVLLLLYLHSLLGRSALADTLAVTHADDAHQRRAAESWANDSLGHPVGDDLLRAVVEWLKNCVRESDTISRQGGDELIILLNDVRDSDAVVRVADKIQLRMGEPFMLGNRSLSTSFSIGIALYPDDGEDFDSLLQKADTAMDHAKESGRNNHRFFTAQMNLPVVEHMTLQTQMRQALENDEFVLHYQPQMDLHDGRIYGVEALIRWHSPDKGLVAPDRFIEVAENSGLIVPIGAWVLNEACLQACARQDAGLPPFVVAVYLSAAQFKRLDLVATVINALVLSDLDAQWPELELTESIPIQDADATLDSLRRLKALGVKLSVDDFGTGYSSLTDLKRFSVDKLKINQSFVRNLASDPDDAAIVRAIIQMARSLKLRTVAEGVESEALIGLLQAFQCDEIQGYWFARPMPADALAVFVRKHQDNRQLEPAVYDRHGWETRCGGSRIEMPRAGALRAGGGRRRPR